jgi:hypothetical protein
MVNLIIKSIQKYVKIYNTKTRNSIELEESEYKK